PPSWVSPPEDVSAALGGLAVVSCAAQGSPDPSLSWSRETASGEWAPVDQIRSSSVEEFVTQFEARVSHHNRLQALGGLQFEENEPDLDDKSSYSESLGPMEGESLHANGLGSFALGTVDAGGAGCGSLQVVQDVISCRWCRMRFAAGGAGCN
ncbi:uncharacterized protein LOC108674283, partial [Hyalella azteca]|uniref:Uncharacterized protein LOC108674283 n=1 Tax=Hyalella azteca TaxID=294128 RepID=A0A8B7NVG2_HYAAZ